MQLKADKFTVSLWHNTMINFAITICVTCHCKMKLLANWNETPKTKPSHEEYTRSVIIMESGKTWYGLTNPKIFSSITNVVHFPCGNRQAPQASEQGTKQVGTCLLRYLSYIDWVFIIPLGKVSAGAKAKSHRHRPSPTTGTKGQAPDFVLYTCKKPSFSFILSFENRTFSKFYLLAVVDREVSVHWVSRMFQLLFEQIPQTAGKYFYIVANEFLNNEPSIDLLHLSAISRSGMFLVMM